MVSEEQSLEAQEKAVETITMSMITEGAPSVNAFKVQRLYPNSYKSFEDHGKQKAGLPEEAPDLIITILIYKAEVLFAFFDESKIYLNITGDNDAGWQYKVSGETNGSQIYTSRAEATSEAFYHAFSVMEAGQNNISQQKPNQ